MAENPQVSQPGEVGDSRGLKVVGSVAGIKFYLSSDLTVTALDRLRDLRLSRRYWLGETLPES